LESFIATERVASPMLEGRSVFGWEKICHRKRRAPTANEAPVVGRIEIGLAAGSGPQSEGNLCKVPDSYQAVLAREPEGPVAALGLGHAKNRWLPVS
jgi:hypothetical protein